MSDESVPYSELALPSQHIAAQHLRELLQGDIPASVTKEQVREVMLQLNMPVWALGDLFIYAPLDMLQAKSMLCQD